MLDYIVMQMRKTNREKGYSLITFDTQMKTVLMSLARLFHKLEGGDCHDRGSLQVVVNESLWPDGS